MKKLLFITMFCMLFSSCKAKTINLNNLTISSVNELLNFNEDYFLFIYADWCTYCQKTIPHTKEYFKNNDELNAQYLNIDTLEDNLKKDLFMFLNVKMKSSDPSFEKERLLVPNISYFKNKKLLISKTGLGTSKDSAIRNIENIITDYL